jgi:peptidoglycan hydrolase-like protein with peptidoglycan-binding domain
MRKRTFLIGYFGAVLLWGAAPVVSGAQTPEPPHTSVRKKKSTSSKSRRTPKPAAQKAPTPDRIREIQSALQREGAYQGNPTGKWDDSTIEAMKTYQGKNGMSPTGKIDALTLEKLGLGSDTAGKGAPVPAASKNNPPSHAE